MKSSFGQLFGGLLFVLILALFVASAIDEVLFRPREEWAPEYFSILKNELEKAQESAKRAGRLHDITSHKKVISADFTSDAVTVPLVDLLANALVENGWKYIESERNGADVVRLCKDKFQARIYRTDSNFRVKISLTVRRFQRDVC